ncbi:MAG: DMT family transporter [FCB group bacterium]|nr:DMT family transporter [FCB group bacterium]MBL7027466.1 DMT family transporter [Candidatus Neomarinimicrobiota bacterium]MBL7122079.1 DMT family transporter [Candidatus Neomarinimicrobiota bacterium]
MKEHRLHHVFAVLQALLVTFLWSTSFIIIKWGLADIPPITYAGLRYFLAFLCFLPFIFKKKYVDEIKGLSVRQWYKLLLLGFVFYTLTQGTQFLGLSLLPAVSVSLMLNFTPIVVAIMGIVFINEIPSRLQWSGAVIFLIGIIFYFFPISFEGNQGLGLMVMTFGVLANSGAGILGRDINRQRNISPMVITFISMGVGSIILLLTGFLYSGIPTISVENWMYLIWLAVVNTAFAFTLWNHTLRSISAMESSILNGTMLIQIAFLAWFFLDEKITTQEGIGMGIAALGATLVQLKRSKA